MRKLTLTAFFKCMVVAMLAVYLWSAVFHLYFIPKYSPHIGRSAAVTQLKQGSQSSPYRLGNLLQVMDKCSIHTPGFKILRKFPILLLISAVAFAVLIRRKVSYQLPHRFSPPYHDYIELRNLRI